MKVLRNILIAIGALVAIGAVLVIARTPSGYAPSIWTPGSIDAANRWGKPTATPDRIDIAHPGLDGAESLEMGDDGKIYTGTRDGRIWRFDPANLAAKPEQLGRVEAEPLGVGLADDGSIWVAATDLGLVRLANGKAERVLTTAEGRAFDFANAIEPLADGRLVLSQASTRYRMANHGWDIMEAAGNGRILLFDPKSGTASVLANDVAFANGVDQLPEGSAAIFASSTRHRIDKVWLSGPKVGQREPFLTNLPGYPDNISRDADGLYWIALASPRVGFMDALMNRQVWARRIFGALPREWLPTGDVTWVLAVDANGRLVHSIRAEGTGFGVITSVLHHEGRLYLGRVHGQGIGVITLAPKERLGAQDER